MNEYIVDESIYKITSSYYTTYGEYVNCHRHIPYIYDGLKPSYRKTILACMNVASKSMTKVAKISAECAANFSPHGTASIDPVVSNLVHAGIFDGQGNHGMELLRGEDLPPAAPRYIEAKMNSRYLELFSTLMPFIPRIENECNNTEVEYLPTPIPLSMTFGSLGIGIGTGVKLPAFTPSSILKAYINNSPRYLKSSDGLEIEDYDQLKSLWKTGRGCMRYKIKTYVEGDSVILEGKKGPLKLNWDQVEEWKNEGRLEIIDETTKVPKIRFRKAPRVWSPTFEEIQEEVEALSRGNYTTYLRVIHNNQVRPISLYDWIDITYKNYIKLLEVYRSTSIEELNWDICFYQNFREIADLIINHEDMSYEEISEKVDVPVEIVNRVGQKSINTLRTMDPRDKIDDAKNRIKYFKNLDFDKYVQDIVLNME